MWEKQNRRPDVIEGEFEVIDEQDAGNGNGNTPKGGNAPKRGKAPKGENFRLDPKPPYVTYTILTINIIVWLIMTVFGFIFGLDRSLQLLIFGAKVNKLIAAGQYWRLFTPMFLHVGIMHLFFNSYALYVYGPVVEKLFGKFKFTIIYILSGAMGSLLSYVFSPSNAAGASGAIFGLMGALLYFRKTKKNVYEQVFGAGLFIVIVINLFYGFIEPGIDNWGHIGGLLGGLLAARGLGLYKENEFNMKKLFIWLIIVLIFILGLRYGAVKYGRIPTPQKGII